MGFIRRVTEQDAQEIVEIYTPYVEETSVSFEYQAPSVQEIKRRIATLHTSLPWLVYVEDERVIGYAYASRFGERSGFDWSAQTSVYLHKKAQGKGVGRQLYQALFCVMQTLGYATLYARIAVPNLQSEKFHSKMGFVCEAVLKKVGNKFGEFIDLAYYSLEICQREQPLPHPRRMEDLSTEEYASLYQLPAK